MTESTSEIPSGDLTARLDAGPVICAEGFLFELERRGDLSAGEFVPEVGLEYPDALRALHVDFQRAGPDVVEAFTYDGHREKMRVIGKEDLLERLGDALQIAGRSPTSDRATYGRQHLEHRHLGPRGHRSPGRGARHLRGDGALAVEEGADMIIGERSTTPRRRWRRSRSPNQRPSVVLTIAPMAIEEMADGIGIVETCHDFSRPARTWWA